MMASVSLLLLCCLPIATALDILQLRTVSPTTSQQFQVVAASFGTALPRVSWPSSRFSRDTGQLVVNEHKATSDQSLQLIRAEITEDCAAIEPVEPSLVGQQQALLLDRSVNCTVEQQALAAERSGASLIVIRDTIASAFASANLQQSGSYYNCALGEETVAANSSVFPELDDPLEAWSCTLKPSCATNACVLTGKMNAVSRYSKKKYQACCFTSNWLQTQYKRGADVAVQSMIPVILVAFQDGNKIESAIDTVGGKNVMVWAFNAEENPWNVSMLLTWMLAVVTVVGASYRSCSEERQLSYEKMARILAGTLGRSPSNSSISTMVESTADTDEYVSMDDERLELSGRHAVFFLLGASSLLVLLYYVHLALMLDVFFTIGASAALTHVFTLPLVTRFASTNSSFLQSILLLLATLVAPVVALFWFLARSQTWIWPIQDFMALMICVVFIDVVRLPNLRVATILLAAAFVYDVFFVYVSPLVFGSSVMVDVAAGGGSTRLGVEATGSNQLQQQPMPMVLNVPLVFSVYGGEALLGLGDIIIPGLLVAFCIRYDYCCGHPLSHGYFCIAACAYATGLMVANVMAIVLRQVVAGQPALMYIVPTMLLAVLGFASFTGDFKDMWNGPACIRGQRNCHPAVLEEAEREAERQEEQRPLLAE
ncbi:Signal peptide peptidase-like 2A [Phytophthora boehmeriae]|uniref:Signal peptide peptidase-like 2A n=1 Tax=Phytophthora boehmeriae TaxID=109152 RepID=A0A8T1WM86_9STRA|nr:Signal peptide peptidase-like 2A [Phytophthora boehmeriae]